MIRKGCSLITEENDFAVCITVIKSSCETTDLKKCVYKISRIKVFTSRKD